MALYVSGRQPFLNVGIPGITTNTPVLDITGRVGVGVTNPTADIDLNTIRIRQSLFDVNNFSGELGYFLTRDAVGLKWVNVPAVNNNALFVSQNSVILGVSSYTGINFVSDGNDLVAISTNINPNIVDVKINSYWNKDGNTGIYTSKFVGIGSTTPTVALDVIGNGNFTGVVTAGKFSGQSGIVTGNVEVGSFIVTGISTFIGVTTFSKVGIGSTTIPRTELDVSGDVWVSGAVTALSFTAENFFGTISTAKYAEVAGVSTNISLASTTSTDATSYLVLVGSSGTTIQQSFIDSESLYYNAQSNTLNSDNIKVGFITTTDAWIGVATINDLKVVNETFRVGNAITMSNGIITATTFSGKFLDFENINVSGIATISTGIVTSLTVSGIATIATGIVTSLKVTGVSTFVGLATFTSVGIGTTNVIGSDALTIIGDARVGNDTNTFRVGNAITMSNGIITATTFSGKFLDFENINVSGIATISTGIVTSLTVSGIATIATGIVTSLTVSGIATISSGIVTSLKITGVSTFVGLATFTSVGIGTTNVIGSDALTIIGNTRIGGQTDIFRVGNAITMSNGISTFGNDTTGIKIDGNAGIITSVNPGVAITFVGNLSGTASTAGFATTATNLGAGNTGSLPYQNSPGITTFLDAPATANQVLIYDTGTNKPKWGNVSDGAGFVGGIKIKDEDDSPVSGITTLNFRGNNIIAQSDPDSGISTITISDNLVGIGLSISGISTFGNSTTGIKIDGTTGIITSNTGTAVTFFGNLTGTASTASFATTAFSLQGFTPSTGSVGFASTATNLGAGDTGSLPYQNSPGITTFLDAPATANQVLIYDTSTNKPKWDKVGLGTNTTGNYVKEIYGTLDEIQLNPNSTGAGVTHKIGFVQNPTIQGSLTVKENIYLDGNITIGGTANALIVEDLLVKNKDIILGFTTDTNNNNVSDDFTANGAGVAIASTVGSPLINLNNDFETNPTTYKKIMWFGAAGNGGGTAFAGLATDAWLSNYAFGIGTTEMPVGTRFAAGEVWIGQQDITKVRNINSTGISTFGNSTTGIKIDGTTGIITSNTGTAVTFFGNLTGTASTASFATTAFSLQGFTPSTGSVGFASTATNLANGAQGSLPYQNSSGITSFLSATTTPDQVLIYDTSTNKPKWGPVTGTGAISGITINDDPNTDASRFLLFTNATSGTVGSQNVSSTKLVFNPLNGSLGIGTISPSTPLQVDRYGVKTGFGTFVASAGITTDVDSFVIITNNFKTAEYTIHIQSSSSIQAQKVLVMQNGTSAFSQEYGIMYEPTFMVSIGATVSGGLCKLQFTPESGISGLMTYRFTRETML